MPVNNFSNEILDRINNSPFFRIVFEPRKYCENSIYIRVYTLSSIDDLIPSNENQNFLFKAFINFDCNLYYLNDFEIKCFTGPNFNSATDYFCSFRINKENWCSNSYFCCGNRNLNPMTLNIAPNKIGINQNCDEIYYGKIDRMINGCTGFNTRSFYDYSNNIFKYQIGKYGCSLNFPCDSDCSCCSYYSGCSLKKRYLFKIIFDNNFNQCGEFNVVSSKEYCKENCYEIKFPNDANVNMKLLLLGGLFDAALLPYFSNPDNAKSINASENKSLKIFYILYYFILMIIVCYYIIYLNEIYLD